MRIRVYGPVALRLQLETKQKKSLLLHVQFLLVCFIRVKAALYTMVRTPQHVGAARKLSVDGTICRLQAAKNDTFWSLSFP